MQEKQENLTNNPYGLKPALGGETSLKQFINPRRNLITYSYNSSQNKDIKKMSHKICGHNFEAFEYLEKFPNSTLLIPDDLEVATRVVKAFYSKYKQSIVDQLLPKIVYGRPVFLTSTTIIICDGQLPTGVIIRTDVLRMDLCSKDLYWAKNISNVLPKDSIPVIQLWHDDRLQYPVTKAVHDMHLIKPDYPVSLINYVKRPNFNLYKDYDPFKDLRVNFQVPYTYLVYATGNCRDLFKVKDTDVIGEIIETIIKDATDPKHIYISKVKVLIVGVNGIPLPNSELAQRFTENGIDYKFIPESELPVDDLFNIIDTYIYTPTAKNWDCSSRLIPECKKFNKRLLLTETVKETIKDNLALRYRILDYYGPDYDVSQQQNKNTPTGENPTNLTERIRDRDML